MYLFTVSFDQFNLPLLSKSIYLFKKKNLNTNVLLRMQE